MRNHQKCDALTGQIAFEPLNGRYVKVVGRLVENKQVGIAEQHAGKRGSLELSAREVVDLQFGTLYAELRQHLADTVFTPPLLMVGIVYGRQQIVHQRSAGFKDRRLVKKPYPQVVAKGYGAAVG